MKVCEMPKKSRLGRWEIPPPGKRVFVRQHPNEIWFAKSLSASLTNSGSSLSRLSGEKSRLLVCPSLASCFLRSLACFMASAFRLLMWSLPFRGTLVWGGAVSGTGNMASSWDSPSDRAKATTGESISIRCLRLAMPPKKSLKTFRSSSAIEFLSCKLKTHHFLALLYNFYKSEAMTEHNYQSEDKECSPGKCRCRDLKLDSCRITVIRGRLSSLRHGR